MSLLELASAETEDRFADLLRASTKSAIHGKPQLFMPRQEGWSPGVIPMPPEDSRFIPAAGDRKPSEGVWTSTATEVADGWESAWTQWVKSSMPVWFSEIGILYYPVPSAKILELNTDDDIREIYHMYVDLTHAKHPDIERDMGGMKIHKNFPWHWVAQHFDAVHTSNPSRSGLHMASWDVESTVWFNFNELQKLGKVGISTKGLRNNQDDYEDEDGWPESPPEDDLSWDEDE